MKNVYLWSKSIVSGTVIPLLWFSAKTYFEENGLSSHEWAWHDPFLATRSKQDILDLCASAPPDVFGLSLYVWNYLDANDLAKTIKELYPNCLIVYGGAQVDIKYSNDFFLKHPWVDLVVPSDVYGEPILTHLLDNYDNLKVADIPEVYFHKQGIKFKSRHDFKKREFKWPANIFEKQADYFTFDSTDSFVIYETTRGCPYRCIYCDWGGGTFTKVVKKPKETVYSELEFLANHGVETFYFADANFGIYKEDVDTIKFIVSLKEKYGYPKSVILENAKNNLDRVIEIQRLLISNGLTWYYKISVQNPHDEIKKNIDRVDIPFDQYLKKVVDLKNEFNAPILVETILGLPGDSYQRTLDSIDMFNGDEIETYRPSIWMLLPEAPAYDPKMREQFEIKTKWFEIYTHPFRYKPTSGHDTGVITLSSDSPMLAENVISTYSYSKYEWCDMLLLTMIQGIAKPTGLIFLINYITSTANVKPSEVYDLIYKEMLVKHNFESDVLNEKVSGLLAQLHRLVDDDSKAMIEFDIDPDFPLLLGPNTYLTFMVMLHPQEFFQSIGKVFSKHFNDSKIQDLSIYLANIMIDISYDPNNSRKFVTDYNWYGYFTDKKELIYGQYEYTILDKLLKFSGSTDFEVSDYPNIVDNIQKMKQFFYHRASNQARVKYAKHIIESKR